MMHSKREDIIFVDEDDFYYDTWWSSTAGIALRWSLFALFVLLIIGWFVLGYLHAQRRMKRGLPPLAYHRFLISRKQRARFEPQYQNHFGFYQADGNPGANGQDQGYAMGNYPEPLPVYNNDTPPSYQPPPGATKVDPAQGGFMAPSTGPAAVGTLHQPSATVPPPAQAHVMGNNNPFR